MSLNQQKIKNLFPSVANRFVLFDLAAIFDYERYFSYPPNKLILFAYVLLRSNFTNCPNFSITVVRHEPKEIGFRAGKGCTMQHYRSAVVGR